jgi:hypothetical protein
LEIRDVGDSEQGEFSNRIDVRWSIDIDIDIAKLSITSHAFAVAKSTREMQPRDEFVASERRRCVINRPGSVNCCAR